MNASWKLTIRVIFLSLLLGGLAGVLTTALTTDYLADYAIELDEAASRARTMERPRTFPESAEEALDQVRERALPGVVEVFAPQAAEVPRYHSGDALGRGVLMSSDGWAMVAAPPSAAPRWLVSGRDVYPEQEAVRDRMFGVEFIRMDANNLPVLAFGSGRDLAPGDQVFVLPAREAVVPSQVLRVDWGRESVRSSDMPVRRVALADAFAPGSVVTDLSGALVGLIGEEGSMIPVESLLPAFSSILRDGEIARPSLGVNAVDLSHTPGVPDALSRGHRAGALLYGPQAVEPGSPAATAGLARGDIIVSVGGEPVNGRRTLAELVGEYAPGEEVAIGVIRDDEELTVRATLATLP